MRDDQTTLKFWEEGHRGPELSIGDRVSWESWSEEKVGTVVGINPRCYGRKWKYVVVPDEGVDSYQEVLRRDLERVEDGESKEIRMMKFGRRIKDIA